MTLPDCNTGFVYMILSLKNKEFCYIGETISIRRRLQQHNSGYGSNSTAPKKLTCNGAPASMVKVRFSLFPYAPLGPPESVNPPMHSVTVESDIKKGALCAEQVACQSAVKTNVQHIVRAAGNARVSLRKFTKYRI